MLEVNESPFRAWDKHRNYMAYGMSQEVGELYELSIGEYITPLVVKIGIINQTLMRGTELQDRNGRQIFEGDIVEYISMDRNCGDFEEVNCTAVVAFRDGEFWPRPVKTDCGDPWYDTHLFNFKIIGNIYENPELERSS